MAAIAALGLLAIMVPVSIVSVYFFIFPGIAAATVFASTDHNLSGDFDLNDTQPFFSLYTHVYRNT